MSEKLFKLSKDYQKLWLLINNRKTVICKLTGFIDEVGVMRLSVAFKKPAVVIEGTVTDMKWRFQTDISVFLKECHAHSIEFFDEVEAPKLPEPNMFWVSGAEETPAASMPQRIAEDLYMDGVKSSCAWVECAVRLPDRKMRVWEDEDGDTHWGWVDETPTIDRIGNENGN